MFYKKIFSDNLDNNSFLILTGIENIFIILLGNNIELNCEYLQASNTFEL